jgi:hydrocephalus-inducing protein
MFMSIKKNRPAEKEALIIKSYVQSENLFEFGPLLIKKDPERRSEPEYQKMNSSIFQITNSGKFPVEAQFCLKSLLSPEEGGQEGKSPFIIEPAEAVLQVEETLQLRVFAFPDEAKLFKDEVVCLLKDNPNAVCLPIQCLGAKPGVSVSNDTVMFERALLGNTREKKLTLTNTCPLKVNWRLSKVE